MMAQSSLLFKLSDTTSWKFQFQFSDNPWNHKQDHILSKNSCANYQYWNMEKLATSFVDKPVFRRVKSPPQSGWKAWKEKQVKTGGCDPAGPEFAHQLGEWKAHQLGKSHSPFSPPSSMNTCSKTRTNWHCQCHLKMFECCIALWKCMMAAICFEMYEYWNALVNMSQPWMEESTLPKSRSILVLFLVWCKTAEQTVTPGEAKCDPEEVLRSG